MSTTKESVAVRRSDRMEQFAHRVAGYATPARFARIAEAGIVVLGITGILDAAGAIDVPALNLDGEYDVPSVFSAALLSCAAVAALMYGAVRLDDGPRIRSAVFLAVLFVFLSADEFGQIHERLEDATGVDFQILYAPLVAVCGVAWVLTLRRMWPRIGPRLLFIGGAVAWVIAQALEDQQWHDNIGNGVHAHGYTVMMVFEELLEMQGSFMFGLALLIPVAVAAQLSTASKQVSLSQ
jgi:hypothetical protein